MHFQHKTIDLKREAFLQIYFLRKYVLDKCIWIRNCQKKLGYTVLDLEIQAQTTGKVAISIPFW